MDLDDEQQTRLELMRKRLQAFKAHSGFKRGSRIDKNNAVGTVTDWTNDGRRQEKAAGWLAHHPMARPPLGSPREVTCV